MVTILNQSKPNLLPTEFSLSNSSTLLSCCSLLMLTLMSKLVYCPSSSLDKLLISTHGGSQILVTLLSVLCSSTSIGLLWNSSSSGEWEPVSDNSTEVWLHATQTRPRRSPSNNMLNCTLAQLSSSITSTLQFSTSLSLLWCMVLVFQFFSQLLQCHSWCYILLRRLWSTTLTDNHPCMMRNLTTMYYQSSLMLHYSSYHSVTGCSQASNFFQMKCTMLP